MRNPNRIGEYPTLWLSGDVGALCFAEGVEVPDEWRSGPSTFRRFRVWVPFLGWIHVFAEGDEAWMRARVDAAWAIGLLASGLGPRNAAGLETER